ncbi:MAG: AAA family ATPase [Thermoplasmata archaeon]
MLDIEESSEYSQDINSVIDGISRYYVGSRKSVEIILATILSSGHALIEDFPGIGKTFLAKLFSTALGLKFSRIQFTPDLLPGDITGTKIYKQVSGSFEISRGPVFANIILADEINRAPPKTQSALLEAMEENQVTIEGETMHLQKPFVVIATQNPIEFQGTYPLPEAELDRFMVRISLGYPDDRTLLERRISWENDDPSSSIGAIMSADRINQIRTYLETSMTVSSEIMDYISSFSKMRSDERVIAGPSPRGLISMLRLGRAMALLRGRDFVTPDDIKEVAPFVLPHRIVVKPDVLYEERTGQSIVKEYLGKLEVPK